jgi:hypothetical protein
MRLGGIEAANGQQDAQQQHANEDQTDAGKQFQAVSSGVAIRHRIRDLESLGRMIDRTQRGIETSIRHLE